MPPGSARWSGPGARVTVAVDSEETIDAAAAAGVPEVLIDVNVGLPRCGCRPEDAGRLADRARLRGLEVRGVMGYEGHIVGLEERATRKEMLEASMDLLRGRPPAGRRRDHLRRRDRHLRHQPLGHGDPGRLLRPHGHRLRQARPPLRPGALGAGHGDLRVAPSGPWPTADSRPWAWTTGTRRSRAPRSCSAPTNT